MVLRTAIG